MNMSTSKLMLLSLAICSATQNYCMEQSALKYEELGKKLFIELLGDSFTKMTEGADDHFTFDCSKELLPILAFALQLNSIAKICKLDKKQIYSMFLEGVQNKKFNNLSIEHLIELTNIVDKHVFGESILDALCYIIAEKCNDTVLYIDTTHCPENALIKFECM